MGKKILILFLLALAFILPLIIGTHMIHIFTTILLYMSLSLSWDMMLRTGQLSFSTAAFFGVGAYVSVITVADMGISPVLSIILGGVFAALVAYLIGFAVLKLRLIYFAIVTLALTFVFSVIIRNIPDITGGPSGKILTSSIFNGNSQKIYWLILIITVGVIAISELIRNSKIHFAINSIRNDELTARSTGINVFKYLLLIFVISSAIQGMVGSLYAQQYAFVVPESIFSLDFLLLPIAMALVGGIYSTMGPVVGAVILGLISEYLKLIMPYGHLMVYGIIIVLIILFLPQGIFKPLNSKFKQIMHSNRGEEHANTTG